MQRLLREGVVRGLAVAWHHVDGHTRRDLGAGRRARYGVVLDSQQPYSMASTCASRASASRRDAAATSCSA